MSARCSLLFVLLCTAVSVGAAEPDAALRARLEAVVARVTDGQSIDSIRETPIPDLYELQYGTEFIYISGDGRHALTGGDLLDLEARKNLSEQHRDEFRARALHGVPPEELIEFAPEQPRYVLYVFTDVNCGYCRKLHQSVPELNRRGVAVRYLAYPVIGAPERARKSMESVWCAKDRRAALTQAKSGKPVAEQSCSNPVGRHTRLGRQFGISGTPAMYTENGRELPGYMPPDRILLELGS